MGSEQRGVGDRTHAAGVWAGVAFADTFVVAGWRHQGEILAIGEHQQRDLFADKTFFENDLIGGRRADERGHFVDGGDGVGTVGGHDDALARRQAVGFDDDRHVSSAQFAAVEFHHRKKRRMGGRKPRRRDSVAGHKILGERFARLKLGGFHFRADDTQPATFEFVNDTERK